MKTPTKIAKTDDEKQIAYGIVYEPGVPDSWGDFMSAETIERAAHNFLANGLVSAIDTEHDLQDNGCLVVESFIARKDDPDFPVGAWVMGVYVPDADMWAKVKKGEIGGLSLYGQAYRADEESELTLEIPDDGLIWGETQEASGHSHKYIVKYAEDGTFLGGSTDEVDGHSHVITRGTVTDADVGGDHSHRFNFLESFHANHG